MVSTSLVELFGVMRRGHHLCVSGAELFYLPSLIGKVVHCTELSSLATGIQMLEYRERGEMEWNC